MCIEPNIYVCLNENIFFHTLLLCIKKNISEIFPLSLFSFLIDSLFYTSLQIVNFFFRVVLIKSV